MEIKIQFNNGKRSIKHKHVKEWEWKVEDGVLALETDKELIHYPDAVIFSVTEKLNKLTEV